MAQTNNVTTLNGLFKVVYADALIDLVPDFAIVQKRVPWSPADKELGNYYAQPVNLAHENGFSYGGTAGGAFTLNASIAGTLKEAQVIGSELVLKSEMSYGAASRASSGGQKAFKRATGWLVEDMNNSTRKRLEHSFLYGQLGLGVVTSNTSGALLINDASWCAGLWAGLEGAVLEAFDGTGATVTQHNGDLTITAVDVDAKTVTVSGTNTNVVLGDVLYFKGARTTTTYNECAGLKKILTNSGQLFNIDASAFSLWKGSTVSSVGQISQAKIQSALSLAVSKGLMEKALIMCPPKAWGVLNNDQAALRVYDSSYSGGSKGNNGFEALQFHSTNGISEIVSHALVRDGDTIIVPPDSLMRIGSSDVTFGVPGMDEQFFTVSTSAASFTLQCYSDQAIFLERPAHGVMMTGLTYS